ncbi:MAG: thiamine pyrophosphate-binding protein [Thermoprotei archaeon]|nr:MAG: thiamine pyrophosphate-binding protein [Thermoprotei archaeon]
MKAGRVLLEMLKEYDVKHVFGLPGETTLPLYMEWHNFSEITHVMARDERSASFMADAYAKISFKPGICEGPSVGSTHLIPGVAEAYKASTPMIVLTTDIPLHLEKKNMLTGLDQTSLFRGITKETITITKASEIPHVIRRAFRVATTGKPGPVHIRLPMDVLEEEVESADIYAQKDFIKYPGHRFTAEVGKIKEALELLIKSEKPLIVCGQGVLYSQAWDEVIELAELLGIPVGTTMTGKGSFPETHPLSIGVVGARGGTSFSNKILKEADLIFYIGCNTDSAATDRWTLPSPEEGKKIVHLDISGAETSNNYPTDVILIGDAKATLRVMIDIARRKIEKRNYEGSPWIKKILKEAEEFRGRLKGEMNSDERPINPVRFIKELSEVIPSDHIIIADPGVSAIYTSAFYKVKKAGRSIIFNYSLGALGYAIPASVGAYFAKPESCIVALTGDGSFGFVAGELETISRVGGNINIILFNNQSFGWIRAAIRFRYGSKYFATEFKEVDYMKVAEGFGLEAFRIEEPKEIRQVLQKAFKSDEPTFIEIKVFPEDILVPPVPSWVKKAKEAGIRYIY